MAHVRISNAVPLHLDTVFSFVPHEGLLLSGSQPVAYSGADP